ncbi:MAG TPA: RNA polymerase sigma factor [Terriglobales bacterium]|jgi:RNA polymerase sigma-70 factor (ECF subfamily)|nr:RNA polymerase sigma factor [Terriglobales bacterium]
MPTLMPAVEDSSLPFVAVAGPQGVPVATSCERRREFEKILSDALPRLKRIAMRSLRNPEDAEDAVQDAMLSAFRHIAQFDGRAQMSTWLISIVINAVRMQLRRRGRRQMLSLDEAPKDGQWAISELLVDPSPTPEQTLEQGEQRELVRKLIAGLPSSQQAALRLHQRDDFSIKKAAETLGVPHGTIKAQLTRGRAKLTQRFQNATRRTKTQFSLDLKAGRKAFSSEYRPERTQAVAHLPVAAFNQQQGGCAGYGA